MSRKISTISPGLAKDYSSSHTYRKDECVLYLNAYWTCKYDMEEPEPWNEDHWEKKEYPLEDLKREIDEKADSAELAALAPKYPMIGVTPSNGTLTVSSYTVATYMADDSAAAFTVAVDTSVAGVARDCELVIDCTAVGAVAPTVTWPSNFHPRTDADDFACEAGVRNVYYISEYATGEFVVGGWQETTGGNA